MRLQHTSQLTKIVLIVEFILVAYLLYSLSANIYKSYTLDSHIRAFEEENQRIIEENSKKSADFDYYTSNEYRDKIAKQNFGRVNPGEEVIIMPQEEVDISNQEELKANAPKQTAKSNADAWWQLFFAR